MCKGLSLPYSSLPTFSSPCFSSPYNRIFYFIASLFPLPYINSCLKDAFPSAILFTASTCLELALPVRSNQWWFLTGKAVEGKGTKLGEGDKD